MQVNIGSDSDNHVMIRILGQPDPGDARVRAEIDIQAGFWRGQYPASLHAGDFLPFRQQLQRMYDWQADQATFTTAEGWLTLNCARDRLGHVRVDGTASDHAGAGNTLAFHLDLDQSYLPKILADLASLERELAAA